MSREIREVAIGWEHPRADRPWGRNEYIPLADRSSYFYDLEWHRDHPDDGEDPPDEDDYMPTWPEGTPLGFCIYETTSEGTPVSPVFESKDELADWLVAEGGYSRPAADRFARDGWAPSFMRTPMTGGRVLDGIAARGLHTTREAGA